MNLKTRIILSLKHSFISKLLNVGNQILLVPIFIYFWNINQYGIWLLIVSISGLFSLVDFGMGHYLPNKLTVLKINHKIREYSHVFNVFLVFNLMVFFIFLMIGAFIAYLLSEFYMHDFSSIVSYRQSELFFALFILILNNIFQSLLNFSGIVYVSIDRYYMNSIRSNQKQILNLIMIPIGLYLDYSFIGIAIIMLISSIIIEIVSILDILINYKFFTIKFISLRLRIIKKYYSNAIWFTGIKLYESGFNFIPIFLISSFLTPYAVVVYTVHQTISNIIIQLRQLVSNTLWRESTILYANKNLSLLAKVFLIVQKYSLNVTLIISIIILYNGSSLFDLWLHKKELFDLELLSLMIILVIVQSIWMNSETFLLSWNKAKNIVTIKLLYLVLFFSINSVVLYYSSSLYSLVIVNIILNISILNYYINKELFKKLLIDKKIYIEKIMLPSLFFIIVGIFILSIFSDSIQLYASIGLAIAILIDTFLYDTSIVNRIFR